MRVIPTIDDMAALLRELCDRFPATCRRRLVGASRRGEPLELVSIGDGPQNALVFGGPHANEPAGFLTVLRLASVLCENAAERRGFTWHFIACVDPDGARLNEGWYAGPYTISHYHRHFYRPSMSDQPEWTFPIHSGRKQFDRPLPETLAMMRVIDELRPAFMLSLHNADFGGAYFQITRDVPGLAAELASIAAGQGVPLDLGPIDTVGYQVAGPGVTLLPPAEHIDFVETGGDARTPRTYGASSWHYADRYGTFTLIAEVPLWTTPGCDDPSDAGLSFGHLVKAAAVRLREEIEPLARARTDVRPQCVAHTPFHAAVDDTLAVSDLLVSSLEGAVDGEDAARTVTRAEASGIHDTVRRLPLRACAMFLRLLAAEAAAGNRPADLTAVRAALEERMGRLCAEAEGQLVQLDDPLGRIVTIQTEAALAAARRLR
ncbi:MULTISPECIES: M14 family zinc carboxypeptidase [unclassified Nonomuraea]|uniref:M14 family zinc carboxypeptidase n=1 Tax=unclassified Nonomuraea TaxID=2593643 RepID=UPI0033EEFAA7